MDEMRGHNEGSIYYRSDRRTKVAAVMIGQARHTMSCPHRDHRARDRDCPESQANLAALLALRDAGTLDPRRVRLGPFLQRWVNSLDLAPATIRQHEMIVRVHLAPALGHLTLADLAPSHIETYLARRDLDGQTLRHHRATLRRALTSALRDGIISRNQAALARPPKMGPKERTALDAGQVRRLIEGSRDEPLHALWVVGATCGLRLSEALGLAWSDVDLERSLLHVRYQLARVDGEWQRRRPKTAKSRRTIPLPAVTVETLRAHQERQEADRGDHPTPIDGLVFTTAAGQPIHGTNVLPPLRRTLRRLGLPVVTYHDLRHSTATVLFAAGVPLPVISDILGHSTIRVTADLYRHHVASLSRDAADRMNEAVGG